MAKRTADYYKFNIDNVSIKDEIMDILKEFATLTKSYYQLRVRKSKENLEIGGDKAEGFKIYKIENYTDILDGESDEKEAGDNIITVKFLGSNKIEYYLSLGVKVDKGEYIITGCTSITRHRDWDRTRQIWYESTIESFMCNVNSLVNIEEKRDRYYKDDKRDEYIKETFIKLAKILCKHSSDRLVPKEVLLTDLDTVSEDNILKGCFINSISNPDKSLADVDGIRLHVGEKIDITQLIKMCNILQEAGYEYSENIEDIRDILATAIRFYHDGVGDKNDAGVVVTSLEDSFEDDIKEIKEAIMEKIKNMGSLEFVNEMAELGEFEFQLGWIELNQ